MEIEKKVVKKVYFKPAKEALRSLNKPNLRYEYYERKMILLKTRPIKDFE